MFSFENGVYTITAGGMTYAFGEANDGSLRHLYWGGELHDAAALASLREGVRNPPRSVPTPYEYPTEEAFDYGEPCLRVLFADGNQNVRLRVASHEIKGSVLTVVLRDANYPLTVTLTYRTWGDLPLVGRTAAITNDGGAPVTLVSAGSAAFAFGRARDWRLTHFSGTWGAEYQLQREMLTQSRVLIESARLTDAAFHQMPFFALDEGGASTETAGEVFFGLLSWSGDFRITVESRYGKAVTVTGGVNPDTARIPLAPGETFTTPEFTAGYADAGFSRMSEILYDWQFDHILPRGGKTDKAHAVRPIIYNSWYPYTFHVNEENIFGLIPKAKQIGAELFVIDDGWMPGRENDLKGLGDWVIDTERFPRGMGAIADECHRQGLLFGLWVEPEMCNPDSDLFRAHPDWVIADGDRPHTFMRHQYILDFSRDEVRDWAIGWLDRLIREAKLDYLKWDMNREVTEVPANWRDTGAAVKYMKNVYAVWQYMNETFPDLLLENCASGGGRADFGMVPYSDRVNRSDNADPVDVMILHEGYTTLFVPKMAGGAGNVAPPSIHGRDLPLEFRILSGMTGSMSIGINLLTADEATLSRLREATDRFKTIREGLQDAYVYRIASARTDPWCVWQYCRRDRKEFSVFGFGHAIHKWQGDMVPLMRMRGLVPGAVYVSDDGTRRTGAALMRIGLPVKLNGDYATYFSHWKIED